MTKTLTFTKLILPASEVQKLPPKAKKRLLMLTNMMRDMDLFRKLLVYADKQPRMNHQRLDQVALVTFGFSFTKILISKVYEAWEFFEKEQFELEESSFNPEVQRYWQEIRSFFQEKRNRDLFSFVRNKFGFHFDYYPEVEEYVEMATVEVGDLEFWMCNDMSGNDLFPSSNAIMLTVVCNRMTEIGFDGNREQLVSVLHKLPIEASHSINEFCKAYFVSVLAKSMLFEEHESASVSVQSLSEVSQPFIVARNDS